MCSEQRFTTSVLFPSHSYRDARSQGVMDLSEYLIAESGEAFLSLSERTSQIEVLFAFAVFVLRMEFELKNLP